MSTASIEGIEFLLSKDRAKYHVVTCAESRLMDFVKCNFKKDKILYANILPRKKLKKISSIWIDEAELMKYSGLGNLLKKNKVSALFLEAHSSTFKETWAKKNKINLIVTPWDMQKKLEDKIFFDSFLRGADLPVPEGGILKSESDLNKVRKFPVALQVPKSEGSIGTFFANSANEMKKIITGNKLRYPLLWREFVKNGLPIGVTMLLGKNKTVFSSLRVQAYFSEKDGSSKYYGIQWVKTSFFPKKTIENLNGILLKMSKHLRGMGFYGLANFDLIIRGDSIYFIECNPRLGGAMPQLSYKSELFHNLSFAEEFINACTGKELSADKPFIPASGYEGFTIDMDSIKPAGITGEMRTAKVGFYKSSGDRLDYISQSIDDFDEDSNVFIYNTLPATLKMPSKRFMGFTILHKPLLKLKKNGYTFSENGKRFLKNLQKITFKQVETVHFRTKMV